MAEGRSRLVNLRRTFLLKNLNDRRRHDVIPCVIASFKSANGVMGTEGNGDIQLFLTSQSSSGALGWVARIVLNQCNSISFRSVDFNPDDTDPNPNRTCAPGTQFRRTFRKSNAPALSLSKTAFGPRKAP